MIGKTRKTAADNAFEHYALKQQQQKERDAQIYRQLEQRRMLQNRFDHSEQQHQHERAQIKETIFNNLPDNKIHDLQQQFEQQREPTHQHSLSM